jgi:hypothetical protein
VKNINLTFNETTYTFQHCKGVENKISYEYYEIYINGEFHINYLLEEGSIVGGKPLPTSENGSSKIFILNWKGFSTSVYITNPNNLEEIVKVITYINKNK